MKIKVGITGQSGFIGTHLFNTLNLDKEKFETIPFEDRFFSDQQLLENWVQNCDAIVHLAALNRHNDSNVIYSENILLVNKLIDALENTNSRPHLLFSSSIQEDQNNLYGKSKKEGRLLLEDWSKRKNVKFTGFLIPNVFGPFGAPFYNSVVATFCHQLTHNQKPEIKTDSSLKLIYVGNLIDIIIKQIQLLFKEDKNANINRIEVNHTKLIKVSTLLKKIEKFRNDYFENGIIPNLSNEFDRSLFNTFICFIDHRKFFPYYVNRKIDNRGTFVEIIKLNSGGQVSFSTTVVGETRGNHYHTRKFERFSVIRGKAKIEMRKIGTDEIISFEVEGNNTAFVDMPIWFTHNITNIGNEELFTFFWINEIFDSNNPDTYFEKV